MTYILLSFAEPKKLEFEKKTTSSTSNSSSKDQNRIRKNSTAQDSNKPRAHIVHSSSSSSVSSSSVSKKESSRRDSGSGQSSSHRKPSVSSPPSGFEKKIADKNTKTLRDNCTKGFKTALALRMSKDNGKTKIEDDKLDDLVKSIEHELYVLFNRDTGPKYKAKYRSLISNIKDEKNDEFFRNIINGNIKPKVLVNMSAEDMANKELKEWRNSTNKHDIEKIKSHELDLLKMGSKLVIKTHKGDEVRETANEIKNTESVLPDDVEHKSDSRKSSSKDRIKIQGANTWDHGKHENDKDCDVCNGKITEDAFLEAKFEREKRHKDRHRHSSRDKDRKKSHKSSSSRKDKDRDRDRDRDKDRDKNRDRDKHRDKDHHRHSSKDKDKKKSSSKRESDESKKEEEGTKVAPEVVEQKIAEILASSGALDVAKSTQEMQNVVDEDTTLKEEEEPKMDDSLEVVQDDFNEPIDIDIPALSQSQGDADDDLMKEAEVTSTVSIKTPEESIAGSSNPSVWNGEIGIF